MRARGFAGAGFGGAAGLVYGIAWGSALERSLGGCDLGCVVLIPLVAGLVLASGALGALVGSRRVAGWPIGLALGIAGLAGLVAPRSLLRVAWLADGFVDAVHVDAVGPGNALAFAIYAMAMALPVLGLAAFAIGAKRLISDRSR